MGRITIFTKNSCHFCLRAKRELQFRSLPFVEIDIGVFPDRRDDMKSLSGGKLTVPQIFLNEMHIGGCENLLQLLNRWDREEEKDEEEALAMIDGSSKHLVLPNKVAFGDSVSESEVATLTTHDISEGTLEHWRIWRKYERECASHPDPTDPRLALPTPLVVGDNPQQGGGEKDSLEAAMRKLLLEKNGGEEQKEFEVEEEVDFGCIPLPDGTCADIREVTSHLMEHMPRHKLAYRAKFYTDCFSGNVGVDALLTIYPFESLSDNGDESRARAKAIKFGLLLQQYGILHHVCNEHTFQDTSAYYYRLQPFHEPRVLNSFQSLKRVIQNLPKDHPIPRAYLELSETKLEELRSSSVHESKKKHREVPAPAPQPPLVLTPKGALALLYRLQKLLTNIEVRVTGRDGVDFLSAKNYDDPDYQMLEEGSCQLQCMDPMALATTMTDHEKLVFGITLYNVMVRHAYIKVGVPIKSSQRGAFFTGVSYNVANQILSLDDVEHGIIRANTRHPYHLRPQFVGDDPRRAWAVTKLDPRIHFTLFCGAKSCPPINSYTVDNLENELQLAAEAFVQEDSNVMVVPDTNTLYLSMVFYWYRSDFGASSNKELPGVILPYLPKRGEKYKMLSKMMRKRSGSFTGVFGGGSSRDIKVKFLPYDWGSEAAPGKCLEFRGESLKTREMSFRAPFSKQRGTSPQRGCIPASV